MKIPKVIHQTWKNKEIPGHFRVFAESWRKLHPSWEFLFWDDNDNERFIATHFPWFIRFYKGYKFDIQRVDAVRYFILLKYGGVYVDLDFECLKPVDSLLADEQCVLSLEPKEHCMYHNLPYIISNAFMAAIPQHPFFNQIVKELVFYSPNASAINDFVLETTGPFMLSRIYEQSADKATFKILPSSFLFPLTYREAERHLYQNESEIVTGRLRGAYGVHYHWGTWWVK
jgi:inositol phosphorylceramide mannosyltransferase catalytic subunit